MMAVVKNKVEVSEEALWEAFQRGDTDAYANMYHTYYKPLYNYGYNLFADKEFVKDMLQDLFLELWQTKERLGKVESVKFYLIVCFRRKIVYNVCIKKKEASRVREPLCIVSSYESELVSEEAIQEQTKQLTKELNKLPARQKEAIYLRFYQELSYMQITEVMCLKYQTVRDLIYKGLKQLRQKLSMSLPSVVK